MMTHLLAVNAAYQMGTKIGGSGLDTDHAVTDYPVTTAQYLI